MGMDIYGLKPVLRSKEPVIEWNASSDEERKQYIEDKNKFEQENPGYYFRANIWGWRPIAEVIVEVNELYHLELPKEFLDSIHVNDGAGLKTQAECDKLANFMETYIENHFDGWTSIGLNTGWFSKTVIDHLGHSRLETIDNEAEHAKLSTFVTDKFVKDGEVELDGFIYHTAHTSSIEWLYEFIGFLRECGGFEIY